MSEKDRNHLLNILDSTRKIQEFILGIPNADAFFDDEKTFDAVLMNFVIIGETIARLSESLKIVHTKVPWRRIIDFRNVIAHDYFGLDAEEVWQIIHNNLPVFIQDLNGMLQSD